MTTTFFLGVLNGFLAQASSDYHHGNRDHQEHLKSTMQSLGDMWKSTPRCQLPVPQNKQKDHPSIHGMVLFG